MIGLDVVAFILFFGLVAAHILSRRKNIEFSYGILLEYWSGGLDWIQHLAKKHRKFLRRVGNASIFIGFVLSLTGIAFIVYSLVKLTPTLALVLPSFGGYKYPGPVISVPFWYWLIIIFVIAFPHETFHAIFSAVERVRIKRYGIVYLLLLPVGAFVDPEKRKLKELSLIGKLRIFSAGSFANILTFVLVIGLILLTNFLVSSFIHSNGVTFVSTVPNTSAYYNNLTGVIIGINGSKINNVNDLVSVLKTLKPNQTVIISTTEKNYTIKLSSKNNRTIIGIYGVSNHYVFSNGKEVPTYLTRIILYWSNLLFWLFLFTSGVAVANMLPAKPLDGGLFFEEIFKNYLGKRKGKMLSNYLSVFTWFLLLTVLFLSWQKFI